MKVSTLAPSSQDAGKLLCEADRSSPSVHIFIVWEMCIDSAEATFGLGSLKNVLWNLVLIPLIIFLIFQDGIVSHLKKQAGPASVALSSVAEFEKFIGDKDASVVGE